MQSTESWNKIVSQYNKIRNNKEEVVQASWEFIFSTLFNYSDSEIDSQRPVQMGSTPKYPDIILKNENEDLFVVELKQHTLHKGQDQLISYLNQLKVNIGILVCDNLYIYDFDYTARENTYSVLEIPFIQDNLNGSKFVELFSKDNFDKQKIKDFIKECNENKDIVNEIKNEITSNLASELLKKYFKEKYTEIDIDKILAEYTVSVSKKSSVYTNPAATISGSSIYVPRMTTSSFMTKDATQFMVNGIPTGGKGPTVYAAVNTYIDSHPNITLQELQTAFPDYLAKPGFGKMIRKVEDVTPNEWSGSRFNKHPISLSDGTRITVSTQWKPDNMQSFIEGVKKLGIAIAPVN